MKITIEINTDMAAIADDPFELRRVLHTAVDKAALLRKPDEPEDSHPLTDRNGNRVGWVTF